jgi:hypothetical protein
MTEAVLLTTKEAAAPPSLAACAALDTGGSVTAIPPIGSGAAKQKTPRLQAGGRESFHN